MERASFFLLLILASLGFVQGCTLKENAKALMSVGYFTDREGKTAVDRIEVKMVDKGKFVTLMEEEGSCTNPRSKEISVQYRVKGADTEWEKGGKKPLTSNRPFSLENLNPCQPYDVKVTVVDQPLPVFNVGPFFDGEYSNVYLDEGQENANYEAYTQNPFDHMEITSDEGSAKILLNGFCARTIVLEIQTEGQDGEPTQRLLQNDLRNPKQHEVVLPELEPCTKYQIILDLFLNEKGTLEAAAESDEVAYQNQNFATFYTMPTKDGLFEFSSFDPEAKTLTWDFNPFFRQQDCANAKSNNIKNIEVTLNEGEGMRVVDLAGSKKLMSSDCGKDLSLQVAYDKQESLQVEYDKQENLWSRNVTIFNELISGKLLEDCWTTALDGIKLQMQTSTNDSVELQKPKMFWEDRAIKMKVVCNGSSLTEGDFDTVEFDFEVDTDLKMTGLMSNTEYECTARLFKEDGSISGKSDVWSVSTLETGEQSRIHIDEATKPEPNMESSANLNSFLSITTLVSAALLLTSATTGSF